MDNTFHIAGLGIGPFNLSLAALLEKVPQLKAAFFERKSRFEWHPEVMFADSVMQTSYLKDLVTPVDPTSPYSYLNYLSEKQLFYSFLNTQRTVISRKEFEQYCTWAAEKLQHKLKFGMDVEKVSFQDDHFEIKTSKGNFKSHNICVATGLAPRIPDCAKKWMGPQVFHAKSPELQKLNLEGKSLLVVGGGQTGIEVFRNAMNNKWGKPTQVQLVTRRKSLEPLDESAFTNEYFTPKYVDAFWELNLERKAQIVASQKLASDGNTPSYLSQLYNDLYRLKHVDQDRRLIRILPYRNLTEIRSGSTTKFEVSVHNSFLDKTEVLKADVIVLSTGFESQIPSILEPLVSQFELDESGRFQFEKSYAVKWKGPAKNRIYALNFSRHNHGIIDPQMSLMAWRSAVVVNDIAKQKVYAVDQTHSNFVEYGQVELDT